MNWLSIVEDNCGIKINSMEKFFSRRNEVFSINGIGENAQASKYVVKIHCQEGSFQEPFILEELVAAGVKVPKVIWYDENIMVTEFISGSLLADLMECNNLSPNQFLSWMEILARWLYKLHSAKKIEGPYLSMPDLNLRNFIFDGKDFFGLDFEEIIFHQPERDLGCLAAFILNSDPMFQPWKFEAVRHLIKTYGKLDKINIGLVEKYFFAEMESAAERRKGQRDYLREKINELKIRDFLY